MEQDSLNSDQDMARREALASVYSLILTLSDTPPQKDEAEGDSSTTEPNQPHPKP